MEGDGEYLWVRENDPRLPVENYSMWDNEAYTTAQLENGVSPDLLFPGIGQLFASNKFGWYVVHNGKRVAEREWEDLTVYFKKITDNAIDVVIKYPACIDLVDKHLKTVARYAEILSVSQPSKIAHFAGLAVDPAHRGKGLAIKLVRMSLETLKADGYSFAFVETTGEGSRAVMVGLSDEYVVNEVLSLPYNITINADVVPLFRVFIISL